jgi:hypothetical protein
MIKRQYAYIDSVGIIHPNREAAAKAEFRRLLKDKIKTIKSKGLGEVVVLNDLVESLFELDKLVGECQKEDTRFESAPPRSLVA